MPEDEAGSVTTNGHTEDGESGWWEKGSERRFIATNHATSRPGAVRGMNASLTSPRVGNGLREREPAPVRAGKLRMVVAAVLVAIGVVAGILTFRAVTAGTVSYPAVVTMSKVYDLNFPASGKLADVLVSVGQTVHTGQVLARQDATALQSQLAAAEGVLRADQQIVALDRSPQITPAQGQQDALLVQQAQAALNNSQSLVGSVRASGQAAVAAAQAAVSGDQSLLAADQARYGQACPSGPVTPDPNLNGSLLQVAETTYARCQDLQSQVDKDTATLNQDQAHVAVVETQSQTQLGEAQASVIMAQAALSVVSYQSTFQTSGDNPVTISQAEAAANQAQEQVDQAQQALQGATLVSPGVGVVSEVYGAVGEYVGPEGVRGYAGPAALPTAQSPTFQLFPSPTTPPAGGAATSGSQPLLEIVGGDQQVIAQVPETDITGIRGGDVVKVSVPALHTTIDGTVGSVVLNPARTGSEVTYDVVVTLDRPVTGLLPGMTATVRN